VEDDFEQQLWAERPFLLALAQSRLQNHAVAEDLVSAVVIRALERRAFYQPGNLRGWLSTILRHSLVDNARSEARFPEALDRLARSWRSRDPADIVADRDLVRRALAAMLPRQRLAFVMIAQGYRYDEIAPVLQISDRAINPFVWRARQRVLNLRTAG
jgi:RNA polymerase sigma factor (sigma-70 family)